MRMSGTVAVKDDPEAMKGSETDLERSGSLENLLQPAGQDRALTERDESGESKQDATVRRIAHAYPGKFFRCFAKMFG